MWKDFFYYSKSERRAVYILLILIALLITTLFILPERRSKSYVDTSVTDSIELANFLAGIRKQEMESTKKGSLENRGNKVVLTLFDPNTADSIELLSLGLPNFVVRNVLKYRQKGGRFLTSESFSRIYGLEKSQFEALRPYIRITQTVKPPKIQITSAPKEPDTIQLTIKKSFKYPEGTLVDVGVADTTELKKIPGIGSYIAKQIVYYRNKLGGFYHVSQLEELDYMTPELMKWFKLEGGEIKKIPINRVGLDRLRAHPYINFYQAKVIIEYRRKKGNIKSLSQLRLYEEFTEKDLERLSNYFSFD